MHVDVQTVGIISSSPYLVNFMVLPVSGILVDKIRQKNIFTNTQVHEMCNCSSFVVVQNPTKGKLMNWLTI